jgi:hypothetical protein
MEVYSLERMPVATLLAGAFALLDRARPPTVSVA